MEDPDMNMRKYLPAGLIPAVLFLASSCAPSLCTELRQGVPESELLPMVIQNPQSYEGKRVMWTGLILNTTPRRSGTAIEILEKPRTKDCRPESGDMTGGRFIALHQRFLDPAIYSRGREITAIGTISGTEAGPIGDYRYTYPVVSMTNHILWPMTKKSYDYWPRTYYSPYYPFYDPFYHPLWRP